MAKYCFVKYGKAHSLFRPLSILKNINSPASAALLGKKIKNVFYNGCRRKEGEV